VSPDHSTRRSRPSDDSWSKISLYAALGLAAAGAGIWMMRRRRAQQSPIATIEVVAQRSLGGRARIVWLSAGQREMIVSVAGQQVRMLGQWRKSELPVAHRTEPATPAPPATPLPAAHTHADARPDGRDEPADKPLSPAVSGILRLRGRTGQFPIVEPPRDDDRSTGDVEADAAWAKEILEATGARPGALR
jgi:flagellar biogenesis protein FliO